MEASAISMGRRSKRRFSVPLPEYGSLREVMVDHGLAALGDAYVNFLYSLYLSRRNGRPLGSKVSGSTLAKALKRAGLRGFLPSRTDRHKQADAAEALIAYAWIMGVTSTEEAISTLESEETLEEAFAALLKMIQERVQRIL